MTTRTLGTINRLVVKMGSRVVLSEAFDSLVDEIASLAGAGLDLAVVSSGAVAMGMECLGLDARPRTLSRVQALAALGQAELIGRYNVRLLESKRRCAQVLLTHESLSQRRHAMNIRHTLEDVLTLGLIPIVNENDSVATEELRFGDNDRLAAAVGATLGADLVVLLSDIDALYDADPKNVEGASVIREVTHIDEEIRSMAGSAGSVFGTGGMASKVAAAEFSVGAGIPLIVASGAEPKILHRILDGERVGTYFSADAKVGRRRHWIRFLSKIKGSLCIDNGAVSALKERGSSLLAAGLIRAQGDFERGDAVRILDEEGLEVARGLSGYGSEDLSLIAGSRSEDVLKVLKIAAADPVVHRDDMVLT